VDNSLKTLGSTARLLGAKEGFFGAVPVPAGGIHLNFKYLDYRVTFQTLVLVTVCI
jgi:hypothetical protein